MLTLMLMGRAVIVAARESAVNRDVQAVARAFVNA